MTAASIQTETLNLLDWPRLCEHLTTFAATKLGAIAARHLRIPATQARSETLLAQTREAYQIDAVSPLNFRGIQDIWESLERADRRGILTGDALLAIATTLAGARQLRRVIDGQDADEFPVLQDLVSQLRTYPDLEQSIHHCIDDRGKVTDRANPKLEGIRRKLKQLHGDIQSRLQRLLQRHPGAMQELIITQRSERFVVPVKAPQKDAVPGIVHDVSTSGATLYIEPQAVVELGNQLRQAQRQEAREEEAVRQRLTEQVAEISEDLERLLAVVTTLDLATARARYSLWLEANPPRFVEPSEQTVLRQLRHPLLVWQHRHEEGPEVVPINVVMRPELRVVAITGPNTGGKTVTLKTLGLATLMAKIGLFVPAREPVELPWFEQVLSDIGDEQSIEQSLSTFSGHVKRIERILDALDSNQPVQAPKAEAALDSTGERTEQTEAGFLLEDHPTTPPPHLLTSSPANALILLDEVGAGTDPSEGSALAIALLQYLADHARLTVATTHFGELKALKYQDERFENASVEFDDVSLSPTYRLLWGIPGRSNALTIARRLGLDPHILDQAQQYVGISGQADVNQVIAGLEAQRRDQEEKATQAAQIVAQAERLKAEIEDKARLLREREDALKLHQEQAVQSAIAQARSEVAQVIRTLQKNGGSAQAAQKATESLNKIEDKQIPTGKHPTKQPGGYRPKVGERVRLLTLGGQTAEVQTEPDADGKLSVRFGLMKTLVDITEIESLNGQKADPVEKTKPALSQATVAKVTAPSAPAIRTSSNTVDLRGMRVSDAEPTLDNFIANTQGPIWIIHGHGTGKLKRGVHAYLKSHPRVKKFEPAEQADGGTGVTVVDFK
ncbi:MAG: endonuclease MutS2 [Cyanobacteria bacterium P01_D01_bin.14]